MSDFQFQDENSIKAVFNMEVGREMNDHNKLYNKSLPNQHPMSAITDLETTISDIGLDILAEENRAKGIEGELSNLTTDSNANLVSAINEVDSHADNNATNLSNHINDKSNPHEVTKAQVGLGNVDNTADLDKPLSTATQTALDGKQNNLSQVQLDAVNSGITQALVTQIGTNQTDISTINGKIPSDASSSNQLADKSYVDTADGGLQTQITANAGDIDTIEGKIPSSASSSNQLADKNFVNSSISTNTATFIGTFNSVAELEAYSGTLTNNDYAFVIVTDSLGNTAYDRYKYTTATTPASWLFEYELNNSSFTADQWAAINSGANTTNIGQIATNTSAISGLSTSKQDKIDSSHKLDSDLVDDNGQTNKFVTSAEKAQISTNASNITSLQSGKADKATTLSGYGITNAYTKTEVDTALSGKQDNLTTAQLNAVNSGITSAKVTQYDGYATSKANVGLDNLNADGQMIVDSVDGKISNCILEIPQNIKVEIVNNAPVIKSGSIITLTGSTYSTLTTTADSSSFTKIDADGLYFLTMSGIANIVGATATAAVDKSYSGNSSGYPTQNLDTATTYYNTDEKKWYRWTSDGWTEISRYPLAILKRENGVWSLAKDSNGNDMIFNGAGFIGHHTFVYPNVKVLIPDGFNADGSLKSIDVTISSLLIRELPTYSSDNRKLYYKASNNQFTQQMFGPDVDNIEDMIGSDWYMQYVRNENKYFQYYSGTLVTQDIIPIIDFVTQATAQITGFTIRQPVRLATTEMLDKVQEQVDTNTTAIAGKAGLSDNNTFTGNNTFRGQINQQTSANESGTTYYTYINQKVTNIDYTTNPSYNGYYYGMMFRDKNDKVLAFTTYGYGMSGNSNFTLTVRTRNTDNTADVESAIGFNIARDGSASFTIPTPTQDTTSSTQADTVGARNTKLQGYANNSLSNLSSDGQMVVDSQNGTISNCILEIPQNIKLTLENSVFTVKAGSVAVVANGDTYTTQNVNSDSSRDFSTWGGTGTYFVILQSNNSLTLYPLEGTGSGSTLPEDNTTYVRFYLTTDKRLYAWDNNQWVAQNVCYPLCVVEKIGTSVTFAKDSKGRDLIFNGCGYIGHHAFVYPNVKGLAPDGIDTYRTLKSIETTTNSLQIFELKESPYSGTYPRSICMRETGICEAFAYIKVEKESDIIRSYSNYVYQYCAEDNKVHRINSGVEEIFSLFPIVDYEYNGQEVTDFTIRQPYEGARNLLTDDIEEEVATKQADVTTLTGYDSTQTQTLKNINGVLTWVTD